MERKQQFNKQYKASRALTERGMTLIEIMIVVIIMAMIATGVAVAVIPQFNESRKNAAKSDVAAIRTAVQLYIVQNPGKCPTVEDLKEARVLDPKKRTVDPWENEFVINCNEDEPVVKSLGPNGQDDGDGEDDIF